MGSAQRVCGWGELDGCRCCNQEIGRVRDWSTLTAGAKKRRKRERLPQRQNKFEVVIIQRSVSVITTRSPVRVDATSSRMIAEAAAEKASVLRIWSKHRS